MKELKHFRTALGILVSSLALPVWAQVAPILWQESGVRIRQGYEIEWQRAGETDQSGNTVYTWSDTRQGNRDVYAQKVSQAGVKQWGDQGALVIHEEGRQEDPALIPTGYDDYIFIWNDFRSDTAKGDLYAQKLDADGNTVWDPSGVLLSTGDFDSPAVFRIVVDGSGGAIILWNDIRGGDEGDIYAIRVTADGSIPAEWPEDGLPLVVVPGGQLQLTVDTDGAGGAIVGWSDNRIGTLGKDIYIQRVTVNAQPAWNGTIGVIVCQASGDQLSPKLCPDGTGGAYIVWEDYRSDIDGDLYFQHVSSIGTLLLPETNGRVLISYARHQNDPRIVADGSGNAIIIWQDTRNDPVQNLATDIYGQKVDSGGNLLWNAQGNAVCIESSNQTEARINADGTGGAVCAWKDDRNGNYDIYAQKINASGNTVWTSGGVAVCTAAGKQEFPLVRALPTYSFISWGDSRSGSVGIWYQKLDASGNPLLTANGDTLIWGIAGNAELPKILGNGANKFFIFFQDNRESTVGYTAYLQILDDDGNAYLEEDGRRICPDPPYTYSRSQELIDACSDGGTGAIAVWRDHRDSSTDGLLIMAQRIDADGNLLWNNAGIQVGTNAGEQSERPRIVEDESGGAIVAWSGFSASYDLNVYAAKVTSNGIIDWSAQLTDIVLEDESLKDIAPDGSGGAYITWRQGPWEEGLDYDIYAQHLGASGNELWGIGGMPIAAVENKQQNSRVFSLGADGAIFVWEDQRGGAGKDLYAQRVSAGGQIQWELNGKVVNDEPGDQAYVDLAPDGLGNLFISWQDSRYSVAQDVYLQKMTYQGAFLFPDSGLSVCSAPSDQAYPRIISNNQGGCYVVWEDWRTGTNNTDIYGINLDGNGAPTQSWVTDGNIINDYFHKQLMPVLTGDYADGAVVVWEDKRSSGKAEVINIYTQRVNEHVGVEPGNSKAPAPRAFRLYAPYPNPFNPKVKLQFEIERPGVVRLAVYDLLGRAVEILKDGWQPAGAGEIMWDAKDYASGMYLVQLEFEGRKVQQKTLLLK